MRVPPDTWFTQEVLADGNHLVIKVNGTTTVDYRDPNDTLRWPARRSWTGNEPL
jgi:hypothetical protein